jgi:hypothetical protein
MAGVIGAWALKHPDDALQAARQLAGDDQTRAIGAIVMSRARLDPGSTANWVSQMPPVNLHDRAMERLVKTWAAKDANAAAAWLANQPEGPGKQLAIKAFVDATTSNAPQAAWNWALKLTDPLDRLPALQSVAQSWMNQNADTARAVITASALPADFKTKLLQTY